VAQSNVKLTVDGSQATRALGQVQNKTQALTGAVNTLRNAFLGIGAAAVVRQTVKQATSFQKLDVRLKLLTKASGTYAGSLDLVTEAQKKFNLSGTEALEGITNITARLAPLGVSLDEIKTTFFGFNTAALLAGASAQESSNAFRQLAQALGSGRLQGDEFRSLAEQVPTLLAPIAAELGTTVGGLKKFASEGKLTSDVVIRALKKIEKDGGASLRELIANDPTAVFKSFTNQTEELSKAVGNLFAPAVLAGTKALTKLVEAVTDFAQSPLGKTVAIFTAFALAVKGVVVVAGLLSAAVTALGAKLSMVGVTSLIASTGLKGIAAATLLATTQTSAYTIALGALKLATVATGFGLIAVAIGGIATALIKANEEQKKYNDLIKKGTDAEVQKELSKLLLQQVKLNARLATAKHNNNKRAINSLSTEKQILDTQIQTLKERSDELDKNRRKIEAGTKALTEQEEAAKQLKEAYKKIGDSIATNIRDNLVEAIKGTKSLGDMARNIIDDLADSLIRLGVTQALKQFGGNLFSGLSFANGGRPPVGKASLVGERGPELFVPSQSGTIIPNNQISGGGSTNIVVNVDATNTEVEGDGGQAEELGTMLAAAVQAELVNQQRPGGLLAGTR